MTKVSISIVFLKRDGNIIIVAYQVMEKYLKDRMKRKSSLEEIEHYMKMVKAIERTIEVQRWVEEVYGKGFGGI